VTAPRTLNDIFFGATDRFRDRPLAMRHKRDGAWQEITHAQLAERVRHLSLGLLELGVRAGDRVALLSENRPEWAYVDYACLAARCADVPVYPTLPARQAQYILQDSGAVLIFVSSQEHADKIASVRGELPALRQVISFDRGVQGDGIIHIDEVISRGRSADARYPDWRAQAEAAGPGDLATLIYTSGTTGNPKGVMLTHGNITSNVVASLQVLTIGPGDECLSFLPLSHIFERMVGHYTMLHAGVVINYAESMETVGLNMAELKPTVVASVPRVYEKVHAKTLETAMSGSALRRSIFLWAQATALEWADLHATGKKVPPLLGLARGVADRLVFSKLRAKLGGRLRYFVSGGAPLAPDIARFFYAAGMPILEGYGLTETSPVITVNRIGALRFGTVGKPIPGVEVRIAGDGEILTRGPHVMMGYYNQPEATRETIDKDGWLHTGDIGLIDEDGFLKITDRKKDLIVTAGGKNIAPQPIEALLKQNAFISNAVMLGDRRPYPIALLVPDFDRLRPWARQAGHPAEDDAALVALPAVQAHLEAEAKKQLRDLAPFEVPKKFLILSRDFTIADGELTPKMSIRRRVVEERLKERIDALYGE
jgi:long-chain acyl-CoA synthetase